MYSRYTVIRSINLTKLLDQSPEVSESIDEGVNSLVLDALIEYLLAGAGTSGE